MEEIEEEHTLVISPKRKDVYRVMADVFEQPAHGSSDIIVDCVRSRFEPWQGRYFDLPFLVRLRLTGVRVTPGGHGLYERLDVDSGRISRGGEYDVRVLQREAIYKSYGSSRLLTQSIIVVFWPSWYRPAF
jgi:hypothetical protein